MTIEELLRSEIHKFVKEHIDEVENKKNFWDRNQTYDELGFKDRSDMLKQIKEDLQIALWALTELMVWGMSKTHDKQATNYCYQLFVEEETEDGDVYYKIGDRYFIIHPYYYGSDTIKEVKKVTKLIEVNTWEVIEWQEKKK